MGVLQVCRRTGDYTICFTPSRQKPRCERKRLLQETPETERRAPIRETVWSRIRQPPRTPAATDTVISPRPGERNESNRMRPQTAPVRTYSWSERRQEVAARKPADERPPAVHWPRCRRSEER